MHWETKKSCDLLYCSGLESHPEYLQGMTADHLFEKSSSDTWGFFGSSAGKESAYNAGDAGTSDSIPGSGRSPGGGHDNPLQYSCLENPMDRGTWRATAYRVRKSQT